MDEELTLPEDLTVLTIAEVRDLHAARVARITVLREQDSRTIAEAREMRRLTAEANELASLVTEMSGDDPVVEDLPEDPPPADPEPEVVEDPEADPVVVDPEVEPSATADGLPIAASLRAGDLRLPGNVDPASEAPRVAAASFQAGANQQVFPGSAVITVEQMGEIFESTRQGAGTGAVTKTRLASVNRFGDAPQRLSSQNGTAANTALINDLPQNPRTAAICGPLDVVRPIPDCVMSGRPIRDMFRQIPADRGAFLFQRSVGIADVQDGTAEWTDADQEDIDPADPSTWKACHELVCSDPITAEVNAIFRCLTVDVKQEFSNPEQVQNNINTLAVATDRVAEGLLLAKIDSLSSAYTFSSTVQGALPDLASVIARLVDKGADTIRSTDETPGYELILPVGLIHQLVVDELGKGFNDERASREVIDAAFKNIGLSGYTVTADPAAGSSSPWAGFPLNPPGDPADVLPDAPTAWTIRVIDPRAGFFFSTGEIAFGMQRSPELARQNKIQWFGEQFEGVDKQGCIPWFTVDVELCPNGARSGLIDPVLCSFED